MFDSPQAGDVVFPDAVVLNPAGPEPFAPSPLPQPPPEPERRLIVFVFANAQQELPRAQILPVLPDWLNRSGDGVRILFPGYSRAAADHAAAGPIDLDRVFDRESFAEAIEVIEEKSSWRYGGRATVVICSAYLKPRPGAVGIFDFNSLIELDLEAALERDLLASPEEVFAAIFDRAKRHQEPISRRGLGDFLGVASLGTLLVDALCEDLRYPGQEDDAALLDLFRIRRRSPH